MTRTLEHPLTAREMLLEAFDPNQPRWPKGHPNAGKWRPKGGVSFNGTRSSSASRGRLERDLADVRESIASRGSSHVDLMATGGKLYQLAQRYSTAGAYRKRRDDIKAERKRIMDASWDRIMAGASTGSTDYTPAEQRRLQEIGDEQMKLEADIRLADRDALVWALSGVRKMGGVKPKVHSVHGRDKSNIVERNGRYYNRHSGDEVGAAYARKFLAMDDEKEMRADLARITRYVPADWLRSLNGKGGVSLTASSERAHATKVAGIAGLVTNRPQDKPTMLHELLHVVEWQHGTPGPDGRTPLQAATQGAVADRTRGERLRKLSDITGHQGYEDYEQAREDRFFSPYVGKSYTEGIYATGPYTDTTEFLTMGVQFLFFPTRDSDPANTDRTTVEAVMGMLATL